MVAMQSVVSETGVTTSALPNLHIVLSVFTADGFASTSRILYYVVYTINPQTRLRVPPFIGFPWNGDFVGASRRN